MIYFLYGPDTYRSRQKMDEIVGAYRSRNGAGFDFHSVDADEDDVSQIRQLAETGSLFNNKRMIVLKRVLSSGNGFTEVSVVLERAKADADTLMILWDGGLGKEGEKRLMKIKALADKIQEFRSLAPAEIKKWLNAEAEKRGIVITSADSARLVSLGSDLWAIANELEKLAVCPHEEKHKETVLALSVFEFGDLFMTSPKRALGELPKILEAGQEEFPLFSYLVGYCRTLLIIQSYEERREQIPANSKINPFVLHKGKMLVKNIPEGDLQNMIQYFFAEDYKIKTGASTVPDSLTRILLARQKMS